MSKFLWFIGIFILLVAGIIVYNKVLHPKDVKPKAHGTSAIDVQAYIVKTQNINNEILASGTLVANEQVNLQPEISGKIVQLNLNEGTAVSKGDLLVKIFDEDLQAQLKKQQAQEETAQKTADRLKKLLAVNGVGQQDYDDATTNLKSIQADIEYTQAQISKTEIRAPFSGVVGLRNVSPGAFVTPNTVIATLQQIDPLKIDFTVPEKYAPVINKGDEFSITVDGFKDEFKGHVYAIEPQLNESTRTMRVRGLVQNAGFKLFPGAFAKVDLGLKTIQNAIMIPTQCVIPEARDRKVVIAQSGKAVFKVVELGIRNESFVQVTNNGVQPGDTIITTGIMYLRPNSEIKIDSLVSIAPVSDSVLIK